VCECGFWGGGGKRAGRGLDSRQPSQVTPPSTFSFRWVGAVPDMTYIRVSVLNTHHSDTLCVCGGGLGLLQAGVDISINARATLMHAALPLCLLSFLCRGIDAQTYYMVDTQQYVQLLNYSGCGNTGALRLGLCYVLPFSFLSS
jgi:hypothetical protein